MDYRQVLCVSSNVMVPPAPGGAPANVEAPPSATPATGDYSYCE